MKKQNFYMSILFTALLFLCGCNEDSSESQSNRRAIDNFESNSSTENASTQATTETTPTPLETFERITEINDKNEQQTTEAPKQNKHSETAVAETQSEWFSENRLFEMELQEKAVETDFIETWYRFPKDEETETTFTTVIVVE